MRKAIIGAPALLLILVLLLLGFRAQVGITWRLIPVQQAVILPPALDTIRLTPGETLVQRFILPADARDLLSTAGTFSIDVVSVQGRDTPDVRVALGTAEGKTVDSWLVPSAVVAAHTVTLPVTTAEAGRGGAYGLSLEIPPTTATGAAPGSVDLAYAPLSRPPASSLTVSGRRYPGTLALSISGRVPVDAYLLHYPAVLLGHRTTGSSVSVVLMHILWLLSVAAVVCMAAAFGASSRLRSSAAPSSRRPGAAP